MRFINLNEVWYALFIISKLDAVYQVAILKDVKRKKADLN